MTRPTTGSPLAVRRYSYWVSASSSASAWRSTASSSHSTEPCWRSCPRDSTGNPEYPSTTGAYMVGSDVMVRSPGVFWFQTQDDGWEGGQPHLAGWSRTTPEDRFMASLAG